VVPSRFTDIRRFDTIDSTNRYLLDEARRGAPEGVVAVADHQEAGRGRLGRRWEAPPGSNLLVSVLLRPDLPPGSRHLAAAVVALAAADAVAERTGTSPGIKWPNDLLGADSRKLAGVLAEADLGDGREPGPAPIVVGIGINVGWPAGPSDLPPELADVATSIRWETGEAVDREDLLNSLLTALEPRVVDLGTPDGRARLAAEFRGRCTTLGTRVRVTLADGEFEGTAVDITPEGHLEVDTPAGRRTVVAGDVVHVRPTG
jgi:BirA family transcriptional regulator, biotin operon repressor / biotin---[acetyl-CoA-carboxylase] ligase